jgi:hypothetical protein
MANVCYVSSVRAFLTLYTPYRQCMIRMTRLTVPLCVGDLSLSVIGVAALSSLCSRLIDCSMEVPYKTRVLIFIVTLILLYMFGCMIPCHQVRVLLSSTAAHFTAPST